MAKSTDSLGVGVGLLRFETTSSMEGGDLQNEIQEHVVLMHAVGGLDVSSCCARRGLSAFGSSKHG